jgi:hypothetical protein
MIAGRGGRSRQHTGWAYPAGGRVGHTLLFAITLLMIR